ncbi:MAG: hypothetical protein ABMA14_07310 [Hyphomonadaceae bacterium]
MAFCKTILMSAATLVALGACTTVEGNGPGAAVTGVYAGKSVLDAAIEAAGGEAALSKVQELYWTGTAKVTAPDKVTDLGTATIVRPFLNARFSSWPTADGPKKARTIQVEQGKAWDVNKTTWTPMPEPQAKNENQQMGLYSFMLLTPLKSADATVKEQPVGADGTRAIQATYKGQGIELEFDANAKLVRAGGTVADPKGGPDIVQIATFSGEVVSNGVKWPQHIAITQNGAPFFEVDIAKFEASPTKVIRPLEQSLQYDQKKVVPGAADAG